MFQPLLEYFQGSPVALIGLLALLVLCGLGLPIPEDIILLTTGVLAARYDALPGTLYLIRPDQHIAARWRKFDAQAVAAAMARAIGY